MRDGGCGDFIIGLLIEGSPVYLEVSNMIKLRKIVSIVCCFTCLLSSSITFALTPEDYKKTMVDVKRRWQNLDMFGGLNGFIVKRDYEGKERVFLITAKHGVILDKPVNVNGRVESHKPDGLKILVNGEEVIVADIDAGKDAKNAEFAETSDRKNDVWCIELTGYQEIMALKDQFADYKSLLTESEKDKFDKNKDILLVSKGVNIRPSRVFEGEFGEDIVIKDKGDGHDRRFRGFRATPTTSSYNAGDCGSLMIYKLDGDYKIVGMFTPGSSPRDLARCRNQREREIVRSHLGTTHDSTVIIQMIDERVKSVEEGSIRR